MVAMVVACGDDTGGGGGPVSIDALFPEFLDALCTGQANCGTEPDKATCIADRNVKETDILTVIADVKAGTVGYDAAKAGACLAELRTATCDNSRRAPRSTTIPLFCIFERVHRHGRAGWLVQHGVRVCEQRLAAHVDVQGDRHAVRRDDVVLRVDLRRISRPRRAPVRSVRRARAPRCACRACTAPT